MSLRSITLPAFAKINWSLRVRGKRADGYHEIDTVLQTISLQDTLTFLAVDEPGISLRCDDRAIPADERNLVWRAAAALQTRCGENRGVRIRLAKRIPVQAGLGGGSSDAAVTLVALSRLWQSELNGREVFEIAEALGADVPFFLFGGAARATGVGKTVSPVADPSETYLLVLKPSAGIATSDAYDALNSPALTTSDAKIILSSSQADDLSGKLDPKLLHNDFEAAAFQLAPEIGRAQAALMKSGAQAALLAGSGSAVFGVFENKDAQERAIQAIELEAGWRVFPCKTVGRSHYETAMGPAGEILARLTGENAGA
ncbi:MAG TPA: 4-(cytidine 5'-diphospho)-2-C-methyl-D-erythritol kinase [Pyrinomonadaceae bacterium]